MMSVAREKRKNRKVTGGMSRKPILLKTKLPPQKMVATIIQNVAMPWVTEAEVFLFMEILKTGKGVYVNNYLGIFHATTSFSLLTA